MTGAAILLPAEESFALVASAILAGRLAVIPTDTVYGLAALPTSVAVARLYGAKGRPEDRPIPVLLSCAEARQGIVAAWPLAAQVLAQHFWPGPLTIVVPASPELAPEISAGSGMVGVRVPACGAALEVLHRCGGHLAVTSANRSGGSPACTAEEALAALGCHVEFVLDGGGLGPGLPSTVVVACESTIEICRLGALGHETVAAALPPGLALIERP